MPVIEAHLNRTVPPKLLKERHMLENRALRFPAYHFLFEVFDRKLQQYIEADLIDFSLRSFQKDQNPKKFEEYKEPFAILTLGELEAGFVVCLVPLVVSILVFGIEWMQTLKALVVFLFIFKHYFELKKARTVN